MFRWSRFRYSSHRGMGHNELRVDISVGRGILEVGFLGRNMENITRSMCLFKYGIYLERNFEHLYYQECRYYNGAMSMILTLFMNNFKLLKLQNYFLSKL
jgi:hypothetical protein